MSKFYNNYWNNMEAENRAYYDGDHFQFWIGSRLEPTSEDSLAMMSEVKRIFQSCNILRQCVDIYADALVSNLPIWYLAGVDGKVNQDNLERQVQQWLTSMKSNLLGGGDPFIQAITNVLVSGRGYLRVFQPSLAQFQSDVTKRVYLHSPPPSSIVVDRDDDGLPLRITYHKSNGKEIQELDYQTGNLRITVTDSRGKQVGEVLESNFGGQFTIIELTGKPLLTPSVKSLQNDINMTLTMKSRNTVQAGFLHWLMLNTQPPGRYEYNEETGIRQFIPEPIRIGAGMTAFLQGVPIMDESGENIKDYTTPQIAFRDPVDTKVFLDSVDHDIQLIYWELGLGHLLTSADGSLSGVSRETLKDTWVTRLKRYVPGLATAYTQLLRVIQVTLAPELSQFYPVVEIKLNTGRPLPEERQANRDDYNAGIISLSRAMSTVGIEDPDSEQELINRENQASRLTRPTIENNQETYGNQDTNPRGITQQTRVEPDSTGV